MSWRPVALWIGLICTMLFLSHADASSRGIKNNNPGNLIKTNIPWKGKTVCADKRFECFTSPYFGVRAMVKTLITYHTKYGLHSIQGIVNRWSPPHENNTTSFVDYITHRIGSTETGFYNKLPSLVYHMIRFESGENPYSYMFIAGIIYDTVRDSNPSRFNSPWWSNETMGNEDGERETAARANHAGICNSERRENRDQEDHERTIYLDKEIYSYHNSSLRFRITEAGPFPRPRRGVRVDGVESRVLVLYRW